MKQHSSQMKMNLEIEMDKALLDVRKSYRLLCLFQKTILSYVNIIHQGLGYDFYKFDYYYGPPKSGKKGVLKPFNGSDWEFLPLSLFGVMCKPKNSESHKGPAKYKSFLYILIIPDTSHHDKYHEDEEYDHSAEQLGSVAESKSRIDVMFHISMKAMTSEQWCESIAGDEDWPATGEWVTWEKEKIQAYREEWNLVELVDKDALDRRISAFRVVVNKGIDRKMRPQG